MSDNPHLLRSQLSIVEKIAHASKFRRFLYRPFHYTAAILHRTLIYPYLKKSWKVTTTTFFDSAMTLRLPAATDIYLTGGKAHDSEIRLAKFLINRLKEGDCFLDVGAHYGYFTLLAAQLVGDKGQVFSFEASPTTFELLQKNVANYKNIKAINQGVSDKKASITFYEFPSLYSEYNAMDITPYQSERWFTKYPPKERMIATNSLSNFFKRINITPNIIKIDVEGAEYKVIQGAINFLSKNNPLIIMEYLSRERGNEAHQKAKQLLETLHFQCFVINQEGQLDKVEDINQYFRESQLDSDNLVFG